MNSRIKSAAMSSFSGILYQLILLLLNFITRKYFITFLGNEFLGLNSVFSSILQFLNLAELGVSSAVIYNLYKPMAERDEDKIRLLLFSYKRIYSYIAVFILFAGCIMMLFVPFFIEGSIFENAYIRIMFFISLLGTVSTYFTSYKRSLLLADQKNYVAINFDAIVSLIFYVLRIFSLIYFKSFPIYLILQITQNISSNILCTLYCNKNYSFIKGNQNNKIQSKMDLKLNNDIKNVFIYKISFFVYNSTDNLIISKFVGILQLGLYSNYQMIFVFVSELIAQISNAVLSGLGNLVNVNNDKKEIYKFIEFYTFLCFCLATFCCVGFLVLMQNTIYLWLGSDNLIELNIVVISCVYFFVRILRTPIGNLYFSLGMYKYDKIGMIFTALINIVISLLLVKDFGIVGVLIGTAIADVFYLAFSISIIFKKFFSSSLLATYIRIIVKYILLGVIEIIICSFLINKLVVGISIPSYVLKLFLCVLLPNTLNIILSIKFNYFIEIKRIISSLLKLKRNK